jgi:uncharacterized protein YndB with AHSA1/START domain
MASIRKETVIEAPAAEVWAAMRDVGALHRRLVPGFVTDTKLEGNVRTVTFGNGQVAQETIIDVDDQARRLAYSASSPQIAHHSASAQIFPEGEGRCRFVWIADVLPNEIAGYVGGMMEEGTKVLKRTMESAHKAAA